MKKGCISFLFVLFLITVLAIFVGPDLIDSALRIYYPKSYSEIVSEKAAAFELDENLVYAVIHAESKFDEQAESHAGARGLMQLTEETFEWINGQYPSASESPDILNPTDNIHAGCALLSLLLDKYGSLDVALSAYNAGMGNTSKWLEDERYSADGTTLYDIPFPETKNYVRKVNENYKKYQQLYME